MEPAGFQLLHVRFHDPQLTFHPILRRVNYVRVMSCEAEIAWTTPTL